MIGTLIGALVSIFALAYVQTQRAVYRHNLRVLYEAYRRDCMAVPYGAAPIFPNTTTRTTTNENLLQILRT